MASGSETTSRTCMRPPHLRHTVTSMAKTRARRLAQPMRRGVGEASGGLGARVGERQRELGPGRQRLGLRDDADTEPLMACEDAVIAGHVKAWRRDQGAQTGHELLDVHVDVGNAETRGLLEEDAHTTVRERLDGIVGEGWAQQVAAQALKLLAVATVDSGGGVQVHAERRHGPRGRVTGSAAGARCGPANERCTQAASGGSRSKSSSMGPTASSTCASTAVMRSKVGAEAAKKRRSVPCSSKAPSVMRQCRCT